MERAKREVESLLVGLSFFLASFPMITEPQTHTHRDTYNMETPSLYPHFRDG